MVNTVKNYMDGLKYIFKQDTYDINQKYGRVLVHSRFTKSTNIYKVPLGELYSDFNEYGNTYNITINDFYIIAKGYNYSFKEIKKEIYLSISAASN